MARHYGLIGYPLSHSFSPGFFGAKFKQEGIDAVYDAFPLATISAFTELLNLHKHLRGLNVTIPYKETVIPYLDDLSEAAAAVGAVNCIDIKYGKKTGYNTDITGFENSLLPLLQPHHTSALILGSGGASKAVRYVLKKMGIAYLTVSRNKAAESITYEALTAEIVAASTLIVNTTPLGMHPETDTFPPIDYSAVGARHLLYDLVYNPPETKFLSLGKERGAVIKNGLDMLHLQALESWRIWEGE